MFFLKIFFLFSLQVAAREHDQNMGDYGLSPDMDEHMKERMEAMKARREESVFKPVLDSFFESEL